MPIRCGARRRARISAQPVGREHLQDPGKPHPRGDPGCRRRLRHEVFSLSRARPGAVGGEKARPAGQMDSRALGCVHDRHPGPRQPDPARTGARRRAAISRRSKVATHRQYGRLSVELRAGDPDRIGRRHVQRRSMRSRRSMSRSRASSRTPCRSMPIAAPAGRRRPMRRAADRLRRAPARRGGRRTAPAQFHQARGDALPDARSASIYDSGDFARNMDGRARRRRRRRAFRRGAPTRRRAAVIAGSAMPSISSSRAFRPTNSPNCASIPSGTLTILMGTQSSGQGHQTAYAQLAAERLGLPLDKIRVLQGDTDGGRLWPRHRRFALAAGRRRRPRPRRRQADRQGQAHRRASARGGRGRCRL